MRSIPLLLLAAAGCTRATDDTDDSTPVADCVPFEAAYDANAAAILETSCGSCHGATPEFGAPYSLVDGYADLLAGPEGERKVDAIVQVLLDGSMPPENSPQLSHNDLDTLMGWASCGLEHPDESDGLVASRDVWEAPADPPADATAVDLLVGDQVVDVDDIDDYRQFTFTNLVETTQFIRRIDPVVDETRVLHHITLTYGSGFPYLYAWAPGTGAIEFPDGGMAIEPGDSFIVEVHYNNGAGIPDAVDNSGVRMWVADPVGTEYGMASPNTWRMNIPPGESREYTHTCKATMDFDVHAGMPHMHEVGSTFSHTVERADGSIESLIELTGWSFEAQYFYEMPVHINEGDILRMTCGYVNDTDQTVVAGLGTSDEMCFDFLVVTPASAATQCL